MLKTTGFIAAGALAMAALLRILVLYVAPNQPWLGLDAWTLLAWSNIVVDCAQAAFCLALFKRLDRGVIRTLALVCALFLMAGGAVYIVDQFMDLSGTTYVDGKFVVTDATTFWLDKGASGLVHIGRLLVATMVLLLGLRLGGGALVVGLIAALLGIGLVGFDVYQQIYRTNILLSGSSFPDKYYEDMSMIFTIVSISFLAWRALMAIFIAMLSLRVKEA